MGQLISSIANLPKTIKSILFRTLIRTVITIKNSSLISPATQPNFYRRILPYRPGLYAARIFTPQNTNNDDSPSTPRPLIVMVHGGGFLMGTPSANDDVDRFLADRTNSNVISLDYAKLPRGVFPAAYEDIVTSIQTLLANPSSLAGPRSKNPVAFDPRKVLIIGVSAGGNLAFAAAQDERLKGSILGVCGMYPLVDMSHTGAYLMSTRPDPNIPDFINEAAWDNLKNSYTPGTTDFSSVKLSPTNFKTREDLPRHLLLMGAEHDLMCQDAKMMAERLQVEEEGARKEGRDVGRTVWKLSVGMKHGFDAFPEKKGTPEEEARVKATKEMWGWMEEWVKEAIA